MSAPRAIVPIAPGINCNEETTHALNMAGAIAEEVHVSQLYSGERRLDDYQIAVWSGGFSHGDDIASGRILGTELRTKMADDLNRFKEAGKALVGICNGFQVLVETGMLPDGRVDASSRTKTAALIHNASGRFEDRWTRLLVEESHCAYANPEDIGNVITLPIANGEGRWKMRDDQAYMELVEADQVVFRYCTPDGHGTEEFPHNPSGSPYGIAGICDESGVILGMMPHPERYVVAEQHPNWRRGQGIPFGRLLFEQIVAHAREL